MKERVGDGKLTTIIILRRRSKVHSSLISVFFYIA